MEYDYSNDDDFTADFDDDDRATCLSIVKYCITGFLVACIFAGLGIAIFTLVNVVTSGYIKKVDVFDPVTRSTQEGNGLFIERDGNAVKLKNTGTYDVLAGIGIDVNKLLENYPIVSVNESYVTNNTNITCDCQNITTHINATTTLTADQSIIMTPNPLNPTIEDGTIGINETYVRENLNVNDLTASTGLNMTVNPWSPIEANTVITLDQEYVKANLNLSSLEQSTGITITTGQWNPSGSGSTIAIDQSQINANLNLSSLSATNNISITTDPWNPSTSGNATIQFLQPPLYDLQGFFAIMNNSQSISGTVNVSGWSITTPYTWSKGGFDAATGIYIVPTSGIYEFNFKVLCSPIAGSMWITINGVNTFISLVLTSNIYYIIVAARVEAGDTVTIVSSGTKTITGAAGTLPYITYYGINKIGS